MSTISRVLNNKPDVGTATRKRVLSFLAEVGYGASEPARGGLPLIGVVDTFERHSLNSYYLSSLIRGIDARLSASRCFTTLVHSDALQREQRERREISIL